MDLNAILSCYDVLKRAKPGRRFQDYHRCRRENAHSGFRSVLHIIVGLVLIVAGLILGLLPGLPGIVLGIPGIALIGGEFQVTARLLDHWEPAIRRFARRLRGRSDEVHDRN